MNEKRYKVVQDARGYWGIWDRETDDFASWGYPYNSGAWALRIMAIFSTTLNLNEVHRNVFEWDGEYLPRGEA